MTNPTLQKLDFLDQQILTINAVQAIGSTNTLCKGTLGTAALISTVGIQGRRGRGWNKLNMASSYLQSFVPPDLMMLCLCSPGGGDRGDLTQFKEGMAKVGSKVTKMELVTSAWFGCMPLYSQLLWVQCAHSAFKVQTHMLARRDTWVRQAGDESSKWSQCLPMVGVMYTYTYLYFIQSFIVHL